MSNSTITFDPVVQSQASKEITVNAYFDAASPALLFGRRQSTCSGLTWGYYGGNLTISGVLVQVANGTVSLTASATNYLVAQKSTGVVSASAATTDWANEEDYFRLYEIVAGASTVSSYIDSREMAKINTPPLGTMAAQNASSVAITGGAIDGTPIGNTTRSTGKFGAVYGATLNIGYDYIGYNCIFAPFLTPVDAGVVVFEMSRYGSAGFAVWSTSGSYGNAANATVKFGYDAVTNRSLNAGGTINASGADYAEYERNNGLVFAKGDIVGFRADGTLTNIFSEAIRFGVKSTNPSYVGGDTWGAEDEVGKRPDQPVRTSDDAYSDEQWGEIESKYFDDLDAFNRVLESARQLVDRIAYSGKVPCNVYESLPGGYIIAAAAEGGKIKGEFVVDPDFSQYKIAVGRVNRILDDGRCEVAVIVH